MKHKVAYLGVFSAIAIILGYVETLIPVFTGIPGIKLGLANLAVLFILKRYSLREAALVSVVRILVIGFLFGSMFSIVYSLAGAALSLTAMTLLIRHSGFSILGISVAGGVAHNLGQLAVAMLVLESTSLIYYVPVLLVSGVLTGLVIGTVTGEILRRVPPSP
ncbi:MAG: Gx transporter family protein [Clostridiales bacterium]|nr:Gx transporter family protein [Clostridiales bacterium]